MLASDLDVRLDAGQQRQYSADRIGVLDGDCVNVICTIERKIRAHARAKGWAGLVYQRVYRFV